MAKASAKRFAIHLTSRAIEDIRSIEKYSVSAFGQAVADRYLLELQAGLDRIRENPKVLSHGEAYSSALYFYRVSKHYLICVLYDDHVMILAVLHTSMDLPERLRELEPRLADEIDILRSKRGR